MPSLAGANGFPIISEAANDLSGISAASAGDVNGDGFAVLIAGADHADPNGNADAGASYIVFGRKPDAAVDRTGTAIRQTRAPSDLGPSGVAVAAHRLADCCNCPVVRSVAQQLRRGQSAPRFQSPNPPPGAPMQPIAARATNTYALGIAVTAGAALSISLNSIAVIQVYAHGGNAQTVVLLRYVFFILAFVAIAGLLGKPLGFGRGHLLHAFGSGAVAGAGSMGLLGSYSFIPISLTIVLVYTYPILTALMMAVLQRRRPSAIQLLCLMVALAGVALTIGIDRVVLDPRGLALAALASFGFAGAIAWNAVALRAADASLTSFYMALSGTAVVAITVVATGTYVPPSGSPFGSLSGTLAGWLAMLASSICFSLAFLGMYRGVQMIGGTPAAMVMNLEPVLTVVLAAVLLGERLTQQHLIGGLMVIGAVIGSQIMEVRKVKEA